jgi:hypothetical protein
MKFLCTEDDDDFILIAKDINEARESVAMWGATLICQLPEDEE